MEETKVGRQDSMDVIRRTIVLLDEGRGWTKYEHARDEEGTAVGYESTRACRWCLSGALARAIYDRGDKGSFLVCDYPGMLVAMTSVLMSEGFANKRKLVLRDYRWLGPIPWDLAALNDDGKYEDVRDFLDRVLMNLETHAEMAGRYQDD